MTVLVSVMVQMPAHSALAGPLSYAAGDTLPAGTLVRVPLGKRETLGLVWPDAAPEPGPADAPATVRPVAGVLDGLPPLNAAWRDLVTFAARYYQRAIGEVALAALPPQLRGLDGVQLARRLRRRAAAQVLRSDALSEGAPGPPGAEDRAVGEPEDDRAASAMNKVALTVEQACAIDAFDAQNGPFLLFGATGSGKTEVYLRCVQHVLEAEPDAQVLVMVPEINLTPQLEARFRARFAVPETAHAGTVVSLHSGMTNPQRLSSWLAAHTGAARIVLGTRMAIFASMPRLRMIVVDEEHDPSYKQQEGARYSARDLALWRGQREGAKVLLGSATPSLESWHHSRPAAEGEPGGRLLRLCMPSRIGAGALPRVRLVDMDRQPRGTVFSPPLLAAISERIARGEQAMVLLNRRGYAPVLTCHACGWKSECPHCSAYRVFHKIDRTLRCHHCGFAERVPRACPDCGNPDIATVGRGTERLEEHLGELLSGTERAGGGPVRVARIDADSTRAKGTLETKLAAVHAGDIDVLVGTQMIAKGHDFRRITLVAAVNPDGALFSSDFRAPERLFALLMQAGGRAGRDAAHAAASEMWIQTAHPGHPLFAALKAHDYPAFAASQLAERSASAMPPFAFQALVRAEARTQEAAQAFLIAAREAAAAGELDADGAVAAFSAVPMSVQRVADIERAQMLLESHSRQALQRFLAAWQPVLHATRAAPEHKGVIRWAIDVDPLAI